MITLRVQHGRWVYLVIDIYVNTIPKFVFVFSFLSYIIPIIFLVSCLRLNNYIWGEFGTIYFATYYFFLVLSSSLDNSNLEENEKKFDFGIFRVITYLPQTRHRSTSGGKKNNSSYRGLTQNILNIWPLYIFIECCFTAFKLKIFQKWV